MCKTLKENNNYKFIDKLGRDSLILKNKYVFVGNFSSEKLCVNWIKNLIFAKKVEIGFIYRFTKVCFTRITGNPF